jgi:outer membrane receptor protein involved in Fe transport
LAVYQNGVRINEPIGDSMNWDLVPEASIASINLIGGANPIFGLNTLGGALSITTKDGFTNPGNRFESYGGSFERIVNTLESGANNGKWGYYLTANYFDEDGWRDASPSDAYSLFGAISFRQADTTLDLTLNHADTNLIGNGSAPSELLELDRTAVFTSPDITENKMTMINLSGTQWLRETIQLSSNVFYRKNKTNSFNGDGSDFAGAGGNLQDGGTNIQDQNSANIPDTNANGTSRDAINNISNREQEGFGVNIQATILDDLMGHENQFIFGSGYQQGLIKHFATVEIASLACTFASADCTLAGADRSTVGTNLFVPSEGTNIRAHNRTWSLYATDTFLVNEKLSLTASARYNNTHIVLGDRTSQSILTSPDNPGRLNGEHDYDRLNPAFGITYNFNYYNGLYASYSESSRAPTPIELLCADQTAPCSLPNAFLSDPPLEQVVTKSFEGGLRGTLNNGIAYTVTGFHSTNNNDIIFGSTGGATSSRGFFRNVGDTQRAGTEVGLSGILKEKLNWYLNYSFVDATFQDAFIGVSANHPNAADLNGDGTAGEIQVNAGDRIPGIPQHSFKIGGNYSFNEKFSIGANMIYNSTQVLRGDESNQLGPVDGYAIINLNSTYKINKNISVFASINNLFDTDYETFGLLGEASEIFDGTGATQTFSNNVFLGPGSPISGFVGLRITF